MPVTISNDSRRKLTAGRLAAIRRDRNSGCIFNFPDEPLENKTPLYHGRPRTPIHYADSLTPPITVPDFDLD